MLDPSGRVVGLLDQAALLQLDSGSSCDSLMSRDFVKIRENTKLIDAARMNRPDQPMAVVDEDDRFVGMLESEQISPVSLLLPPRRVSAHGEKNV